MNFRHTIDTSQFPPLQFSAENMQQDIQEVRECKKDVNSVIEGLICLAFSKVQAALYMWPHQQTNAEDIEGEALLALTIAVHHVVEHDGIDNPVGYISQAIINAIFRFVSERSTVVRVPIHAQSDHEVVSLDFDIEDEHTFAYDNFDMLMFLAHTPIEQEMIKLLAKGYTIAEVATQIDVARLTANRARQAFTERFQELVEQLEGDE